MKLFKTTAAMMMLAMSALLGTTALAQAQTTLVQNCRDLTADAGVLVGLVCVAVDPSAEKVWVEYSTSGNWKLSEINVWIGDNAAKLPKADGNPQVSVFPHGPKNLGGSIAERFSIPFSELSIDPDTFCSADVIVAANAVVTRTVAGSGGGKSEKSVKSAKGSKADKSAKNSKGSKDSKKEDKNSKGKDSSAKSGKGNTQTASTSSSKSSKSTKTSKSGKSGASTGGGTGPVTETVTAWAGDIPVGNGYYFSFKNDFCVTQPVVKLFDAACYNVFAGIPGTAASFTPVGFSQLDPAPGNGWINTFLQPVLSTSFLNPNNAIAANLTALAFPGSGQLIVEITSVPLSYKVSMSNIYYGPSGSFNNVSPLSYGISTIGTGADNVIVALPGMPYPNADLVVHAMICPTTVNN